MNFMQIVGFIIFQHTGLNGTITTATLMWVNFLVS